MRPHDVDEFERQWATHLVEDPTLVPRGRHYAVLSFRVRQVKVACGMRGNVDRPQNTTSYYVFGSRDDLVSWVSGAVSLGLKFVFFEVECLGEAVLDVDLGEKR